MTSTDQEAAVERLEAGLGTVNHPRRRFGRTWRRTARWRAYGGLELALGGEIGGWVRGGAAGALEWFGKGTRKANWRSAAGSSASGAREETSASSGGKAFIAKGGDAVPPRRLATQAGKQLRALMHAGSAARVAAALDRAPRSTSATVAIHIPLFVCYAKFRPKSELQSKFYQNKSCAEFYKLQNVFWCPKLILSGKT